MDIAKMIMGIILCIVGALLALFEFGIARSEPHTFRWLPFLFLVALNIVIVAGGILLCTGSGPRLNVNTGIMGSILCIVGAVFVLFASVEAISQWHSFLRDGWVPFVVFVVLGMAIFAGGILLYKR